MSKPKKVIKFNLGDLVRLGGIWKGKVGIVTADDKAWWVIKDHYDIANSIVHKSDVVKVLKKQCVPKKYIKLLARG